MYKKIFICFKAQTFFMQNLIVEKKTLIILDINQVHEFYNAKVYIAALINI